MNMNELDRKIKDIEVLCFGKLFLMSLYEILEIAQIDSIQITEEMKKMVRARFLRVRENLELILKFWERANNDEQDEMIEKLKKLVIKQTKTAALLDPLREVECWQRLDNAGFYDDNSDLVIIKYVIEIYQRIVQQNTVV